MKKVEINMISITTSLFKSPLHAKSFGNHSIGHERSLSHNLNRNISTKHSNRSTNSEVANPPQIINVISSTNNYVQRKHSNDTQPSNDLPINYPKNEPKRHGSTKLRERRTQFNGFEGHPRLRELLETEPFNNINLKTIIHCSLACYSAFCKLFYGWYLAFCCLFYNFNFIFFGFFNFFILI